MFNTLFFLLSHMAIYYVMILCFLAICCILSGAPIIPPSETKAPWWVYLAHMAGTLMGLFPGIWAAVSYQGYNNTLFKKGAAALDLLTSALPGISTAILFFVGISVVYWIFIIKGIKTTCLKNRSFLHFLRQYAKSLVVFVLFLTSIALLIHRPPLSHCDVDSGAGALKTNVVGTSTPLMEGIIALHSDIWAIMLFVAIFALYILYSALSRFNNGTAAKSYKVHHNSTIEIIWTTLPALLLCVFLLPFMLTSFDCNDLAAPGCGGWVASRDFDSDSVAFSPHEAKKGWLDWFGWFGPPKTAALQTPLEAAEKNTAIVEDLVGGSFEDCLNKEKQASNTQLTQDKQILNYCWERHKVLIQAQKALNFNMTHICYETPITVAGKIAAACGEMTTSVGTPVLERALEGAAKSAAASFDSKK